LEHGGSHGLPGKGWTWVGFGAIMANEHIIFVAMALFATEKEQKNSSGQSLDGI